MSDNDVECIKKNTVSNGYTYLQVSPKNELSLVVSRFGNKPFLGKIGKKNYADEVQYPDNGLSKVPSANPSTAVDRSLDEEKTQFYRFDPNEVYGSFKPGNPSKSDRNDMNTTANDIIKNTRKFSKELCGEGKDDSSFDKAQSEEYGKAIDELEIFTFTKPLQPEGLVEEGCQNIDYENLLISQTDIKHLEHIRLRAYFGYYHQLQPLYEDIVILLKYVLANRCKNSLAKVYISEIMFKVQTLFKDRKRALEFKRIYREEYDYKFELNYFLKVEGKWDKIVGPQRKYIHVNEYKPVINDEETLSRLKTTKTSK